MMGSIEDKLINEFKEFYYRVGEKDLKAQIPFLNDLAKRYYAKCLSGNGAWMDGPKAHGLFTACGARDIAEREGHWLKKAKLVEIHCIGPFEWPQQHRAMDITHRKLLKELRSTVEQELNGLDSVISCNTKEMEELFCDQMKRISLHCTEKMKCFTKQLLNDCIEMLGTCPCGLAVAGMGSLARGEMTPYSDLEYMFLIEKEEDRPWFHKLALFTYFDC